MSDGPMPDQWAAPPRSADTLTDARILRQLNQLRRADARWLEPVRRRPLPAADSPARPPRHQQRAEALPYPSTDSTAESAPARASRDRTAGHARSHAG